MVDFPSKIWGICPKCGSDGGDAAAADVTSADATDGIDTTGNGLELFLFRGEPMCKLCSEKILNDERDLHDSEMRAEEEKFRARAGYAKTI